MTSPFITFCSTAVLKIPPHRNNPSMYTLPSFIRHHGSIILILLIAFALRVIALADIPPGLSHDEAANGIAALEVLQQGKRPIFFEINKGIEPLIIYLEALAFYAFGIGPFQLRLVNLFCGMLTVALTYPLTHRLFNRRVATMSMVGVAVSFWAIFVSRLTLRAVLLPPLLLLTLYWLWLALTTSHRRALLYWVLSGLAAGVSMYTYLASRFIPLIVLTMFVVQQILSCRTMPRKEAWLGLLLHLTIWGIIFTPLATYYWQNQESFSHRANQVTTIPHALNGEFGPMLKNSLRTLGMLTFEGDETDRYNLNRRPVFDWLNGLFFYLGLVVLIRRVSESASQRVNESAIQRDGLRALLLLSWLFFMLMPDFITDDSPHFLRTIGTLPVIYMVWAVGIGRFGEWANMRMGEYANGRASDSAKLKSSARYAQQLVALLPLFLLILMFIHTSYDYFYRWANAPEARYIYGADIAGIARFVKQNPSDTLTVISAEYYQDLDPFRYQIEWHGSPPFTLWFDGQQSIAFSPPELNVSPRYFFSASAPPAKAWLPFLEDIPDQSGSDFTLYRPDMTALQNQLRQQTPLGVTINNEVTLLGYQVLGEVMSGGKFQVLLSWQAISGLPPGTDYSFLVRMWDSQGHLWSEADGLGYAPDNWQPGVQGLQLLTLRLPLDLPPQPYYLTAELLNRQTGQPLPSSTGERSVSLGGLLGQLHERAKSIEPEGLPHARLAVTGESLALRGYQIANRTVSANERLSLTLHWQVVEQPTSDNQLEFYLLDDTGYVVYTWPFVEPINGAWPTNQWPTDYWVQNRISLPIIADIPIGQFQLHGCWSGGIQANFAIGSVVIEQ
ncbi:glycosyltransferase family 39 protein [Anaerolineales bacterium HSG24]|nr:glycosyltransferase family 39 protein [Anaerolineales bacterium HSG24]